MCDVQVSDVNARTPVIQAAGGWETPHEEKVPPGTGAWEEMVDVTSVEEISSLTGRAPTPLPWTLPTSNIQHPTPNTKNDISALTNGFALICRE